MDITSPAWRVASAPQRKIASAPLAESYDQLMDPLLDQALRSGAGVEIVGSSGVGRLPIYRIAVGSVCEEKHRVLVVGGIHPREWQAVLTVHQMLAAVLKERESCGLHTRVDVLPMVNPDGFELSLKYRSWRGNGNNVDLNRNFGVGWNHGERASSDPLNQNYCGEKEESEPETQIISSLLKTGGYSCCLLYTSDAADEEDSVDLGGRRIIKKKTMIRR
eukprot:TRINITY_DN16068_c0_g1_i6.p1 TRINITY_DN16068_c0_g1~~TRINITY_DN16068_c0_g1_i6.p1  ORF type:complete len:219 (-),score=44.88 TRINITY_DN16068_c0_g1_i6:116-772(-)